MKKKLAPSFQFERGIQDLYTHRFIAGVDEVGRGALAGPLVAAAVIFDISMKSEKELRGVDDSKKLNSKNLEELAVIIKEFALDFSFGSVSVDEIDRLGVGVANILAFKRALDGLKSCNFALIDGRQFRGFDYPFTCLEKGESKSLSIAAASIIAKVHRDNLMVGLHERFPDYDFLHNKGYGSKKHISVLLEKGQTEHHRRSFTKFLNEPNQKLF